MIQQKICLDNGWKFYQAHSVHQDPDFGFGKSGEGSGLIKIDYDDSSWQDVNLPHDFVTELPYDYSAAMYHGYKQTVCGEKDNCIVWYRKHFFVDKSDTDSLFFLEFDGCYRDAAVWLNGHFLGRNLSGYVPFRYNINDFIKYSQENVITVRLDISQPEGWWYEGGGIYRHVWLHKYPLCHIDEQNLFIRNDNSDPSLLYIDLNLKDEWDYKPQLKIELFDAEKNEIHSAEVSCVESYKTELTFKYEIRLPEAHLWDINDPYLYTVELLLVSDSETIDRIEKQIGFRTLKFDAEKGFFLNDKQVFIKGVCMHQDFAGVGIALTDDIQEYKLKLLKEMGCNAIRTSHHMPAKELLDICDRIGMLVMDENRVLSSNEDSMRELETLILRDRNHPCVFIWSIGNEEHTIQNTEIGTRIGKKLKKLIYSLDGTRLVTYGGNNGNNFEGLNEILDVRGWNYRNIGDIDSYHAQHPYQPIIATEEGSTFGSRGIYEDDFSKGFVASSDNHVPNWGDTAEGLVEYYSKRPYISGYFIWTGFDYRGEANPTGYLGTNSQFGIMDACGYPKDIYYFYKSVWTNEPVLHAFVCENKLVIYSNLVSVSAFIDGTFLGEKAVSYGKHIEFSLDENYSEITVLGKDLLGDCHKKTIYKNGNPYRLNIVREAKVENSSDGTLVFDVDVLDSEGRPVKNAEVDLNFKVDNAYLVAFGNGAPVSSIQERGNYIDVVKEFNQIEYSCLYEENGEKTDVEKLLSATFLEVNLGADKPLPMLRTYANGIYEKKGNVGERVVDELLVPDDLRSLPVLAYKINTDITLAQWQDGVRRLRFDAILGEKADIYFDGHLIAETKTDARNFSVELPCPQNDKNAVYVVCRSIKDSLSFRQQLCGLVGTVKLENINPIPMRYKTFSGKCAVYVRPKDDEKEITVTVSSNGLIGRTVSSLE